MIIDTNSWHYKLLNGMERQPHTATNVCQYVRRLIWALFQLTFTVTTLLAVCAVLLFIIGGSVFDLLHYVYARIVHVMGVAEFSTVYKFKFEEWQGPYEGNLMLVILLGVLVQRLFVKLKSRSKPYVIDKPESVVKRFFKDVNNSMCTMVEFKDFSKLNTKEKR